MKKLGRLVILGVIAVWGVLGTQASASAPTVHIAVASNFYATLKVLSQKFTQETGIRVNLSNGATGMLFAQISRGAPYDLFFSADVVRPLKLEQAGLIEPGSRFTYAMGRLVVWVPTSSRLSADPTKLNPEDPHLHYIAIANPKTAPYGAAAKAVLTHYGLYETLSSQRKIAIGENVGKAFQYTATGNAQLGFVAKSYVANPDKPVKGDVFDIPSQLYPPLAQQAVVLKGKSSEAVTQFVNYIRSAKAARQIETYGYGLAADKPSEATLQ